MEKFKEILVLDDQEITLEEYEGEKGYLKVSFSELRDQDLFSDAFIYTSDLEELALSLYRYLKCVGDTNVVYTGICEKEIICNDIFVKDKVLEMRTLQIEPKSLYSMIDAEINPYYIVLNIEKIKTIIGVIIGCFYENNQIHEKFHMLSHEERKDLEKSMAIIKALNSVIVEYNGINVENEIKKKNIEKLKNIQGELIEEVGEKIKKYLEYASSK